ncbi:MAG: SDR family NAD(P)-dependent oxidoreductase, partial [Candidatus Gastranaerophilales bacterium]|nr:SDR family NAD(P)-dependent oxidoreductase [Candidatus Gastranaerophilales bacterium]
MSKNVLITGSSKGIGKAIATVLANNGYNVFISGRNEEDLKKLKNEINDKNYLAVDLTSNNSALKL